MEIPKPVAIGIVVVVAVMAIAIAWYFTGGNGGGSSVPESVYPQSQEGAGVEAYGADPLYTGAGPAAPPPIGGQGGGARR